MRFKPVMNFKLIKSTITSVTGFRGVLGSVAFGNDLLKRSLDLSIDQANRRFILPDGPWIIGRSLLEQRTEFL